MSIFYIRLAAVSSNTKVTYSRSSTMSLSSKPPNNSNNNSNNSHDSNINSSQLHFHQRE